MKFIGIIVGVIIAVVVFLLIKGKNKPVVPTKDIDILYADEILGFFKQPEINSSLRQNKNLVAVAIKETGKNGTIHIIATLFDKEKNDVSDFDKKAVAWNAKKIDNQLAQLFGDKEMIVLQ